MRAYILDPGFTLQTGHHRAVNALLVRACRSLGAETSVVGHLRNGGGRLEGAPVLAAFSLIPFRIRTAHPLDLPAAVVSANDRLETELRQVLPPDQVRAGDLFVMHTTSVTQLVALHRWFHAMPDVGARLRLIIRFPPAFYGPGVARLSEALFGYSLSLFADSDRDVVVSTDQPELSELLGSLSGLVLPLVPISVDLDPTQPLTPLPSAAGSAPHVLFPGDARAEKGSLLLPGAILRVLNEHPTVRFTVHSPGAPPGVNEALRRLGPRVRVLAQPLPGDAFLALVGRADLVMLPYDAAAYSLRTSHILVESLGLGRPVVTTPDTWMSRFLHAEGNDAGVTLDRYDAGALAEAVLLGLARLPELGARAAQAAPSIRARHNPSAFVYQWLGVTL